MAFSKQFFVTFKFYFTFALYYLLDSSFTISVETLLTFKMYWHVTNCFVLIVFPWSFNFNISFAWPTSLKALLLSLTFTFVPVTFQNFPFYMTQAHVERPMWSSFQFYNFLCLIFSLLVEQFVRGPIKLLDSLIFHTYTWYLQTSENNIIKNVTLPRLELITFAISTPIFMTSSPIV